MVEFDRLGRFIGAVHYARHLAAAAQTAARTRTLQRARKRSKFNFHSSLHNLDHPRPDDPVSKNSARQLRPALRQKTIPQTAN
jgi:hypothetical protein